MNYLKYELYEKACISEDEKHQIAWECQRKLWLKEFSSIKERLPKRFVNEFLKTEFHDANIQSLKFIKDNSLSHTRYILEIVLNEYRYPQIQHALTFLDVLHIQADICVTAFAGCCDWLYAEILPNGKDLLSFEIAFSDNSSLYFDFKKMRYKKTIRFNQGTVL